MAELAFLPVRPPNQSNYVARAAAAGAAAARVHRIRYFDGLRNTYAEGVGRRALIPLRIHTFDVIIVRRAILNGCIDVVCSRID